MKSLNVILSVLGLLGSSVAGAQDWLQWRGPHFDGSAAEQKVALKFSKTEGLAWTAPMPGPSAATPVIHGDRVFVSSTDSTTRSLVAMALDRRTGKELWRHTVADGDRRDDRSTYASPSPVTDGKHVWFFYGQGDLVAYTVEGKEVWRRNIQKDHGAFAFLGAWATSPLLHDGRLYLQVLQRDVPVQGRGRTDGPIESYLLAIDPGTGKDLWRHVRPSEAREEARESFNTPTPYVHEGRAQLLITGGDAISGHDLATGAELWRWATWNPRKVTHWRLVPSPVAGAGIALACAPKGDPIYAFKLGQKGLLPAEGYAWKSEERDLSTDVSTPLFYRGRFFVVNSDKRQLFCVEPATGRILWKGDLPTRTKVEASPTATDGRIHLMSHEGDVMVLGAGEKFEVLHQAAFGDGGRQELRSSIPIAHGQLFIRTDKALYATAAP